MGARDGRQRSVTVSVGGVTVRKELLEDEYPRPAIRYELRNETDEGKTVRLTESVPAGHSASAMGFHPEHGARHWSCDADRAVYERDLAPHAAVATVYGVAVDHAHEAMAFFGEPELTVHERTAPGGSNHAGTRERSAPELDVELLDGAVTDGGENEDSSGGAAENSVTGGDDGVSKSGKEASETEASLDIDIPGEPSVDDGLGSSEGDDRMAEDTDAVLDLSSPTGAPDGPGGGPEGDSVVERLVEELKRNDVDAEDRKIIREQLDLGVSSMTRARINQLSTRVETVAAYADALEEFLDEEGTAQEVIEDFEMQVTALREDVAELRDQASANAGEIGTIDDTVTSLSSRVADLEGTLDSVADRADDIEDSIATTDSHLEAVEGDLRQTECQVATNAETIAELDDDVERLDETAEDIWAELSDVEETVDAVAAGLEDVENDVAEVIAWRDQLGETFH